MDDSLPIDAFIPWVDSNDPAWQEKCARYKAADCGTGYFRNAKSATRFQSVGELDRCLRSIAKNAPWFRKIFILTDNQTPELRQLTHETLEKINIISHQELFGSRSCFLPTFNSIVLDCMVWNLEEMSERFVYFNDDFFISQPVTPKDFFDAERIIIRGHWSPIQRSLLSRLRRKLNGAAKRSTGFADGQRKAAKMLAFEGKYFKFDHAPRGILKSRMKAVFERYSKDVEANMPFRFRHSKQFVFFALYYHAEMLNRMVTFGSRDDTVDIKSSVSFKAEFSRLQRSLADPNVKFLCLQSLDLFTDEQIAEILHQLDRHLAADYAPSAAGA